MIVFTQNYILPCTPPLAKISPLPLFSFDSPPPPAPLLRLPLPLSGLSNPSPRWKLCCKKCQQICIKWNKYYHLRRTVPYPFQGWNKRRCRKGWRKTEWRHRGGVSQTVTEDWKIQIMNCQ